VTQKVINAATDAGIAPKATSLRSVKLGRLSFWMNVGHLSLLRIDTTGRLQLKFTVDDLNQILTGMPRLNRLESVGSIDRRPGLDLAKVCWLSTLLYLEVALALVHYDAVSFVRALPPGLSCLTFANLGIAAQFSGRHRWSHTLGACLDGRRLRVDLVCLGSGRMDAQWNFILLDASITMDGVSDHRTIFTSDQPDSRDTERYESQDVVKWLHSVGEDGESRAVKGCWFRASTDQVEAELIPRSFCLRL
jgi:hypothetical protein